MNIQEMFVRPITRDVKGVIKIGQEEDSNVRQELEEYVVTRELQKHIARFFEAYKKGIAGNTDKMGVWISGFFGSGKSHFLKILSYLLENKEVDGKKALDYFVEDHKIDNAMVLADMKLAADTSADVILFNVDSKSDSGGKENKDAIISVFLKVFNEMQGFYGANPHIADFERELSFEGRFEEYKTRYKALTGKEWVDARNRFSFRQDGFVETIVDMGVMSEEAARNLCEKAFSSYSISIEQFADMVRQYAEKKGRNHHVVFLVDEIGQYIGEDSRLMLNLQTVTEDLGTACRGKAWIIVTSQQDIDSVIKVKGNDFSKIMGRFDTRLSLSSANVDEVIRERILKKTDVATQTLAVLYDDKATTLKNLISFNDSVEKKLYSGRENFAEVYPFVPYQFNLLGDVLTQIRTHGASGKSLADGARSMLALFKESAERIMDRQPGALVPFHFFYDALEQFIEHNHRDVILRALDNELINPDHEQDVMAFIDNLMNSLVYGEEFDRLSEMMYRSLGAEKVLRGLPVDSLLDCSAFAGVDRIMIEWIIGRLETEDINARLNGHTIDEVCTARRKKHFGGIFSVEYIALENAWRLLHPGLFSPAEHVDQLARNYVNKDYLTDRYYRNFYIAYDWIEDNEPYEKLRQLVENIYTNDYLNKLIPAWARAYVADEGRTRLSSQFGFYDEFVGSRKERTVVIISDALRYEVGRELLDRLQADEKCEAKMSAITSMLPSITSYGMAALLPHLSVTMDDDYNVLCDGEQCATLKQREAILQKAQPNSRCVRFDDIKALKKEEMREITSGRDVVYVYHNQIDARGDKPETENEVFVACKEAVEEILALIRRITTHGNTVHFIVTADHGFLYKRDKLMESDKISGISNAGKRYAIMHDAVSVEGTISVPMNLYCGNVKEDRYVCVPLGSDLFKAPGSGLNYVHGGCSPQEMIVPVIDVRTEKGKVSVANAQITLASPLYKITNLSAQLEFLQSEAVSDTVKATTYRLFFADQNGNRISNEHLYQADKREDEAAKRVFKLKFTFKNQSYDKTKKYYLIVIDDKTGMETFRREVIMDLAFAGDFGFGF